MVTRGADSNSICEFFLGASSEKLTIGCDLYVSSYSSNVTNYTTELTTEAFSVVVKIVIIPVWWSLADRFEAEFLCNSEHNDLTERIFKGSADVASKGACQRVSMKHLSGFLILLTDLRG